MVPQGMYDSVTPGSTASALNIAKSTLLEMREAGLTVCLNIAALKGSPANTFAYADYASEIGMQLIWPMNDPRFWNGTSWSSIAPGWTNTYGARTTGELADILVGAVAEHPATRAFYVADEIEPEHHDELKRHSDLVLEASGRAIVPRLAVHMDIFNNASRVAPLLDTAEELGLDVYPISRPSGDYPLAAVGHASAALAKLCRGFNRGQVMVLQAFSWHAYPVDGYPVPPERWPTVDEYQIMRQQAETFGEPKLILWWWRYAQRRATDPAKVWADFKAGALDA